MQDTTAYHCPPLLSFQFQVPFKTPPPSYHHRPHIISPTTPYNTAPWLADVNISCKHSKHSWVHDVRGKLLLTCHRTTEQSLFIQQCSLSDNIDNGCSRLNTCIVAQELNPISDSQQTKLYCLHSSAHSEFCFTKTTTTTTTTTTHFSTVKT